MAINKITDPSALPTSTDDYVAQNNAINNHTLNLTPPYPVSGSNIVKGSVFNIGGDLFYTDSDTAITGTTSDYVKLTPGTSTAVPTYETATNITANVTWSDAYNGYYDSSGNLYIFDEVLAYIKSTISTLYTNYGKQWDNSSESFYPSLSPTSGSWTSSSMLIPRGAYLINFAAPSTGRTSIEAYVSSAWVPIMGRQSGGNDLDTYGGFIFSDGTNVRIQSDQPSTINYLKF